jgi:hypothetical protein
LTSRADPRLLKLPGLWLVFPTDRAEVDDIVHRCRTMVRASADQVAVDIRPLRCRVVRIRFRGDQRHRKARLLRALVAKQYRGILPRIRIRLS